MSKIEWTDETWNPTVGCTKVSAGCKHCFAEANAKRFWGKRKFTDVQCHPDRLDQPLRWRKPRRVFVNSMSDLFHEDVPGEFIDRVFAVMALAQQHTFQILTKRPKRMQRHLDRSAGDPTWPRFKGREETYGVETVVCLDPPTKRVQHFPWPLPNVWLGVSCEDQATADERIPLLLETPAAVRFVSAEPLLDGLNLGVALQPECGARTPAEARSLGCADPRSHPTPTIDWVIVGGESGPGARPCDVQWIRSIAQQCKAAKVACFVKQLGAKPRGWCVNRLIPGSLTSDDGFCDSYESGEGGDCGDRCFMLKHRKGGDPDEWPEDLRVREFPAVGGPS